MPPPRPDRGPWFPHLGSGRGPEQDLVVGGALRAPAWAGGLAGGPGSPRDGKQIPGGGCRGTPGSGNSHGARNEEGASRMRGPTAQTVLASWPRFNPSPSLPGLRAHPPRGPALTAGQPQAPPPGPTFQKHFLGQARAQHTGSSPPEGPPWRLAGPWARRGLLPLFLLGRPVARLVFRSALRGRRTTTAGARLAGSAGSFGGAGVSAWGSGTVSATCSLTQSSTCSCACLALLEARPQAGPRGQGCPALTSEVPALHPTVFPKAAHSGGAAAD